MSERGTGLTALQFSRQSWFYESVAILQARTTSSRNELSLLGCDPQLGHHRQGQEANIEEQAPSSLLGVPISLVAHHR